MPENTPTPGPACTHPPTGTVRAASGQGFTALRVCDRPACITAALQNARANTHALAQHWTDDQAAA